jgi:hypothetical protein
MDSTCNDTANTPLKCPTEFLNHGTQRDTARPCHGISAVPARTQLMDVALCEVYSC